MKNDEVEVVPATAKEPPAKKTQVVVAKSGDGKIRVAILAVMVMIGLSGYFVWKATAGTKPAPSVEAKKAETVEAAPSTPDVAYCAANPESWYCASLQPALKHINGRLKTQDREIKSLTNNMLVAMILILALVLNSIVDTLAIRKLRRARP